MSEKTTIEDTKANEELDEELKKKCAEISKILDENKIEHMYTFLSHYSTPCTQLYCYLRVFGLYGIGLRMNADKILCVSRPVYDDKNIIKFDTSEFIRRCEIIRSLCEYCKVYIKNFTFSYDSVYIQDLKNNFILSITINEDYNCFNFKLNTNGSQKYASFTTNKIEEIFEFLYTNYKELMKPRILNTKPAKLY